MSEKWRLTLRSSLHAPRLVRPPEVAVVGQRIVVILIEQEYVPAVVIRAI